MAQAGPRTHCRAWIAQPSKRSMAGQRARAARAQRGRAWSSRISRKRRRACARSRKSSRPSMAGAASTPRATSSAAAALAQGRAPRRHQPCVSLSRRAGTSLHARACQHAGQRTEGQAGPPNAMRSSHFHAHGSLSAASSCARPMSQAGSALATSRPCALPPGWVPLLLPATCNPSLRHCLCCASLHRPADRRVQCQRLRQGREAPLHAPRQWSRT
jgi:hypothetical protein